MQFRQSLKVTEKQGDIDMYRMRSIMGIIAAVVFVSAATVPVSATVTDWSYHYSCISEIDVGTCTGALDSVDGLDSLLPDIWLDPPAVVVWSEIGGTRLDANYYSPLAPGQNKTWTIKAGLQHRIVFPLTYYFSWHPGSVTPPTDGPPKQWTASLRLIGIPTVTYSGPTLWDLTGGKSGSAYLPMRQIYDVYTFSFSVTAVPEPAPILVVSVGSLACCLGCSRSRRGTQNASHG